MRAVCMPAPRVVEIVDVSEPKVGPEDVLIGVRYIGLCGSDLNTFRGLSPLVSYPRITGHEVSGVVLATGPSVPERVRVGERVTVNPYTECGLCPACRSGRPNCCQFNQTLGVQRDGALTERIAIPYGKVFGSAILTPEELALVEPLSVGYHAANRGQVSEADSVLVLGAGTIGMGAIVAAARKGATVIATDVEDDKLATARRFGAAHTINSAQEDTLARVLELTGGEGVNVAIEAIGLPETFRLAVAAVAYAGRVVYIGYAKHEVSYDTSQFVRKELDIRGSRNALRVFPAVIGMFEKRERPFTELITRTYAMTDAAQAFIDWDARPGRFAKILIDVEK
jgi:L-galactonate 5-dehydrogenase